MNILAIDPGSSSTKIGLSLNGILDKENISHDRNIIDSFKTISDQKEFRFNIIKQFLNNKYQNIKFDAVIGRGGLTKVIQGGTYLVNKAMIDDLIIGINGSHAANLGGILASDFAKLYSCQAFIADPPVVDEMLPIAKVSGLCGIERKSMFHALNQKAMAKKTSKELDLDYNDINIIVAHLGGGISIGLHSKGKVIDVNNGLNGDGPFSPERSGSLPVLGIIESIINKKYTPEELLNIVSRKGGLYSYLGETSLIKIESMIENGDQNAEFYYNAMVYQIAKEISALAAAVDGNIQYILLTGGLCHSAKLVSSISKKISFISKVVVEPGEYELEALISSALSILNNTEYLKEYR